ncbi:MAG: hypothetical protein JWO43_402 [Candidatus Adlerbacteria bacterium]|nr:hypothetical protein [Candidatus Adlerbacteria bacterium]
MHGTALHKPALEYIHNGGLERPSFSVTLVGKNYEGEQGLNWSFLQIEKDEELRKRVASVAKSVGATKIWAPVPNFSAKVINTDVLKKEVRLGDAILWRNSSADHAADGVMLKPGESYAMTPGGCAGFVATNIDRMIGAHSGKHCLVDPKRIMGERNPRLYASIVDSTVGQLANNRKEHETIRVWVFGSLRPEDYPHYFDKKHGEQSLKLYQYILRNWGPEPLVEKKEWVDKFYLDIPALIRRQFMKRGVPAENINLEQAYISKETAWVDGAVGKPRNLFLVKRHR